MAVVGTCINNTSVFMFKKGCFELGATIYPVVIKVRGLTEILVSIISVHVMSHVVKILLLRFSYSSGKQQR